MSNTNSQFKPTPFHLHLDKTDWLTTSTGQPRGYIQPGPLKELWFHTGTICNLQCPFCLEGSKPGDTRLEQITLEEVMPIMNDAVSLGVQQFSFTGGEPFVNKDFLDILNYASERKPCLVLTNATVPLERRFAQLLSLPHIHKIHFRVSLDHPDPAEHDRNRGPGNFALSLRMIKHLHHHGFGVSIARQRTSQEDSILVDQQYQRLFGAWGIPHDIRIVSFPEFLRPGMTAHVPEITESCMTTYHTAETREKFMCFFSKMIVKQHHQLRIFACTLTDDDPDYDLGHNLRQSLSTRVMMKHHRCYACFGRGASCSELH